MGKPTRQLPAKSNSQTSMSPKNQVTMGGPQVPSLMKRNNMSAASPIKSRGDIHVATGRNKGLRKVPPPASPGFAGKHAGPGLKAPAKATSPGAAGKAMGKLAKSPSGI